MEIENVLSEYQTGEVHYLIVIFHNITALDNEILTALLSYQF